MTPSREQDEWYRLCTSIMGHYDPSTNVYKCARELRTRLSSPSVPDGWQLVPKEPTKEMREAGYYSNAIIDYKNEAHHIGATDAYKAMLRFAPQPPLTPSRSELKEIARRCAKAKPKSYYAEPFEPHEWVMDALREVARINSGAVTNDDDEVLFALEMACEHDIHHQAQALRTWLPRIRQWREALRHPSSTGAEEVYCHPCSASGGAGRAIYHAPPACPGGIDMLLFCPACNAQHIDAPDLEKEWDNPPHRSHECQKCGHVWRPADVCTNGVAAIKTKGKRDLSASPPSASAQGWQELYHELLYAVGKKFPYESRHQTALRYIRQCENAPSEPAQAQEPKS